MMFLFVKNKLQDSEEDKHSEDRTLNDALNSCLFTSSFDILKDTDWLQLVKIWNESRPAMIPLPHRNNYSKADLADALYQLNLDSLNTTCHH